MDFLKYACNDIIYSYKIGNDKLVHAKACCFYSFFSHVAFKLKKKESLKFNIFIRHLPEDFPAKSGTNNYLYLTPEEIKQYLQYITTLVPFRYKINKPKRYEGITVANFSNSYVKITLFFDDTTTFRQKEFVITLVRALYEAPISLCLKETMNLINAGYFKGHELFNILNLIIDIEEKEYEPSQYFKYPRNKLRFLTHKEILKVSTTSTKWNTFLEQHGMCAWPGSTQILEDFATAKKHLDFKTNSFCEQIIQSASKEELLDNLKTSLHYLKYRYENLYVPLQQIMFKVYDLPEITL